MAVLGHSLPSLPLLSPFAYFTCEPCFTLGGGRESERASTNYRPHRRMHGKELEEEEEAGLMKVAIHTQSRFARCSDIPTSKQFT